MTEGPRSPVRVDAWLWSVRMFKTRSAATSACRAGKIKIEGETIKPAGKIMPGTRVSISRPGHVVILEVVHTYAKRVGAPVAQRAYRDLSPQQIKPRDVGLPRRERGTGRPTKRERRQLELLRGYTKNE
ncbi:RNA-binding S4 domain-containing protein [Nesterenkonia natronophila]|uniref:RNA-binding S4 domain-containing protein n=1 Tax=Nesterenkonia natronophila TaxID=2174932 RepID=A0A3A4F4S5_9MICC|nr:S4 domain-containing protein [Nesterenkonia natronophila]RJN32721.1 RNA-binding S4 domain-containing protein [Nesterenkonia natronophila]